MDPLRNAANVVLFPAARPRGPEQPEQGVKHYRVALPPSCGAEILKAGAKVARTAGLLVGAADLRRKLRAPSTQPARPTGWGVALLFGQFYSRFYYTAGHCGTVQSPIRTAATTGPAASRTTVVRGLRSGAAGAARAASVRA